MCNQLVLSVINIIKLWYLTENTNTFRLLLCLQGEADVSSFRAGGWFVWPAKCNAR